MLKGKDLIEKIKYEMKHNLDYSNQSVKVPIKDLNLLIELAESNQYRLDLKLMEEVMDLWKEKEKVKKYEEALRKIDNHIRLTPEPTKDIVGELKKSLPEYQD